MDAKEIRKQVVEYVDNIVNEHVEKEKATYDLVRFSTMSHNLYHFMPSIPDKEHWNIYKTALRNRILSNNQDFHLTYDFRAILTNVTKSMLEPYLPGIFATFHFGERCGYFFPLVREEINIALISGYEGDGLKKKTEEVDKETAFTKRFYPDSTAKIELLSYKSKNLFFDMIKKQRAGSSIMWFQDWANTYVNPDECVEVDFLNKKILVPKGMALFSYMTKSPIVPWFSFYDDQMLPQCVIGQVITPGRMTLNEYVPYAMQKLYHELERHVRAHYDQWEGWFNIHRFMTGMQPASATKETVNAGLHKNYKYNEAACMFKIDKSFFVMNRINGRLVEIDRDNVDRIEQRRFAEMKPEELGILYKNGILIN